MGRRRRGRPIHGWLLLDKPGGMTSTEAVNRARRAFDARKAGHAGTLDPLATGLLAIAFGEATKTVPYIMDAAKTYRFRVRWGQATATDDAEGAVIAACAARPTAQAIAAMLPAFQGAISQVPPTYSAIKVDGARSYDLARDGAPVALAPRTVRIDAVRHLGSPDVDHADFEVESGKGAYMRSLARDFGTRLGTFGHIVALRRLRIGGLDVDHAISLAELEALGHIPHPDEYLLTIETALDDIPALALSEAEAHRLRNGQPISLMSKADSARLADLAIDPTNEESIVLTLIGDRPVAVARYSRGSIEPVRVLNL